VDYAVKQALKAAQLLEITEFMGMIPRQKVMEEYESASFLLLPINKALNAKGRIPGKLFEMMRSGKPLLVFGPNDGDVKKIVEEKQKGQSFEYTDEDGLYVYLKKALLEKEIGNFNQTQLVSEFSNKAITEKIAGYLNEITS
jgi:glycosyltransferase involved in cell wall biosynthesis